MIIDTLVVIAQTAEQRGDLLPLWTGLIGGILGIAGTVVAAKASRATSTEQIGAQREVAKEQLAQQAQQHQEQLRATVVSANRARRIETFRTDVAAFIAMAIAVITDLDSEVARDDTYKKIDQANHHSTIVSLLVNHDEQDGKDLVAEMDKFMLFINAAIKAKIKKVDDVAVNGYLDKIGALARRVMDAEWFRVTHLT